MPYNYQKYVVYNVSWVVLVNWPHLTYLYIHIFIVSIGVALMLMNELMFGSWASEDREPREITPPRIFRN